MEEVVSNVVRLDRRPPPVPTLDHLDALTAGDMEQVNHAILDRMQSSVTLIPELATALV